MNRTVFQMVRFLHDKTIGDWDLYLPHIGSGIRSRFTHKNDVWHWLGKSLHQDANGICTVPQMRSSKMVAGSGRATIFLRLRNGGRKCRPRSWLTSFPAPLSWKQDGGTENDVWRTSKPP